MGDHLSVETWTALNSSKSGLVHIETSGECEEAGRHICSISKKERRVISLITIAPQLLNLAYKIQEKHPFEDIEAYAEELIKASLL